jgi:hypothetical protein
MPMPASFETALSAHDPAVRALASELRALILAVEARAVERVTAGAAAVIRYGISAQAVDQVCSLTPADYAVTLEFDHGKDLPDTQGMLTGTAKRARSITFAVGEKLNPPYLRYLLEVAFAQAHGRHETRRVNRDAQ